MPRHEIHGVAVDVPAGCLVFNADCGGDGYQFFLYNRRPITVMGVDKPTGRTLKFAIHIYGPDWFTCNTLEEAMRWVDSNPAPERAH